MGKISKSSCVAPLERVHSAPITHDPKKVSFDSIEIRQYPRILGDNPSVSCGAPISLSWEYFQDGSVLCSIDDWETMRNGERYEGGAVKVPAGVRKRWLIAAGHTEREIRLATYSGNQQLNLMEKVDFFKERVKSVMC